MASGSFTYYIDKKKYNYIRLDWSSRSVGNNTSRVTVSASLYRKYNINSSAKKNFSITINGNKKSGSRNGWSGKGWVKNYVTHTVDVPHNADGSKVCNISCSTVFDIRFSGTWYGTQNMSYSIKLDQLAHKSSFTLSPTSGLKIGDDLTINLSRSSSSVRHDITGSIGSTTFPILKKANDNGSTKSYKFTLDPDKILSHMDSATKTFKVTLTTWNGGTSLGTSTATATIGLRASDKPSISEGNITVSAVPIEPNTNTTDFFQNWTNARFSITPTMVAGGTIKNLKITNNGTVVKSYTPTGSAPYVVDIPLTVSGTNKFEIKVTDSRGMVSSAVSKEITVISYSFPQVANFTAERCTQDGTLSKSGSYIKTVFDVVHSCGADNPTTATIYIRERLATNEWTELGKVENITDNASNVSKIYGTYTADKSYDVRALVQDAFGNTSESVAEVGTEELLVDFSPTSVAIGKVAEREKAFEVDFPAYFSKEIYGTVHATTSDGRLKDICSTDITPLIPLWKELQVVLFRYNNYEDTRVQAGLIAQDIIMIFDRHNLDWRDYGVVYEDESGYYSVNYNFINTITIEVVKALENAYNSLETRLKRLESVVDSMV